VRDRDERTPGVPVTAVIYAQIVNSSPDFNGRAASVLLATDDAEAKEVVARLARDAGYDPWDAGPLWSAYNVEKVAAVMITIAYVVGTGTDRALKLNSR
jgi:predicted dinucleotide-binding enzyme